jgi:putative radical SAM enzyme (TIGR03279 family)
VRAKEGVFIERIIPGSIAEKAGLAQGDQLISINNSRLVDSIDFMYHRNGDELNIAALRNNKKIQLKLNPEEAEDIGVTLTQFKIKQCINNCLFCFVSQLPKGLRKSLYIKDEDYRMSFIYGNYVTLTNLDAQDKKRIVSQRLSPLYISVHSTNKNVRNALLGNPKAGDVMKELKFFKEHKIRMHTQIVLCPGYNDGKELEKTIRDLCGFYPYVSSIAVVPVGITIHIKKDITPVAKEDAVKAIEIIDSFQKRLKKKHGDHVVYGSDELYMKAEIALPNLKEYGDLAQIENGVGMVPQFLSQSKKLKITEGVSHKKHFLTFTGTSFYPFLKKFSDKLAEKENIHINVVPVENTFFGKSITVTGLLTGRDVIKTLSDKLDGYKWLLIPDIVFKDGENVFLDDVSVKDIERTLDIKVRVIESMPEGIIKGMMKEAA